MSATEIVQVKSAAVQPGEATGDFMKDTLVLSMMTEEGVEVKFGLNIVAAAILQLTLTPSLQTLKARGDNDPRVQERKRQQGILPDDLGGLGE